MQYLKVKLFGDSIMGRVVQDPATGRYQRLEAVEDVRTSDLQLDLVNSSKFGATIGKGRRLVDKCLEKEPDCQAILLNYGGNDCNFDWAKIGEDPELDHQAATPLDVFYQGYLDLVARIRDKGIRPVLANLVPIDAGKFFDTWIKPLQGQDRILAWLGDKEAIYRWHEMYSLKVEAVARETDTPLLDLRSLFLKNRHYQSLIGPDGMHPTKSGHDLILESVYQFLEGLKLHQGGSVLLLD